MQGVKGEAVVSYCEPLTTQVEDPVERGDAVLSAFPTCWVVAESEAQRVNNMASSGSRSDVTTACQIQDERENGGEFCSFCLSTRFVVLFMQH